MFKKQSNLWIYNSSFDFGNIMKQSGYTWILKVMYATQFFFHISHPLNFLWLHSILSKKAFQLFQILEVITHSVTSIIFFQNMKIVTRVTIKVNFLFCVCNDITFHQRLQRKISSMVLCCRLFIISTIINHKTFLVFIEKLRLRKMYFVMYHNRRLFYDYLHSPCS